MAAARIYLEEGRTSVFAVALEWPGWCRRAKSADLAIDALEEYEERYAAIGSAPEMLRKGPRGGGRDGEAIVDHVREAERAYCSKIGERVPPRTQWTEQRATVTATLRAGATEGSWPLGYALRRIAWHIVDHAWEIEDKSAPAGHDPSWYAGPACTERFRPQSPSGTAGLRPAVPLLRKLLR